MEPHPVPQNIIDVEFKLFGSFTLKQFSKILIGGLLGIGIFFLNINLLIKIPLILGAILIGFGLAIVPNLGRLLFGFLKAIFVSPRYVWSKQPSIPEILSSTEVKSSINDKDLQAAISKKKLDIDDIPLDMDDYDEVEEGVSRNVDKSIFLKIYQEMYGNTLNKQNAEFKIANPANEKDQESSSLSTRFLGKALQSIDINILKPKKQTIKTAQEYLDELEKLRKEYEEIKRNSFRNPKAEEDLVARMNQLYSEYRQKHGQINFQPSSNTVTIEKPKMGNIINGIVVSIDDAPISNAEIFLVNNFLKKTYRTISDSNGKFSTHIAIPIGEYDIKLKKEGMKFHTYKIKIGETKPPAYKFREKSR